jgi:hypothetical protein
LSGGQHNLLTGRVFDKKFDLAAANYEKCVPRIARLEKYMTSGNC